MILVVGGRFGGKRAYVKARWGYGDGDMADAVLDGRPVLYNLQDMDVSAWEALMPALLQKDVVICDEIGCGVVPLDRDERDRRENVGRLCVALAARAETVVRVQCGLPMVLKGAPAGLFSPIRNTKENA